MLRQIVNDKPEPDRVFDECGNITKENPFFWDSRE